MNVQNVINQFKMITTYLIFAVICIALFSAGFIAATIATKEVKEHDPTNPNSCKCGHTHHLVSKFDGKCGTCWQEELVPGH